MNKLCDTKDIKCLGKELLKINQIVNVHCFMIIENILCNSQCMQLIYGLVKVF